MICCRDRIGALCVFLAGGIVSLGVAAPALGLDFHSDKGEYSLKLSDEWMKLPDAIVDNMSRTVFGQNASMYAYDTGFQLKSADHLMAYPYVLVQVMDYKTMGLGRQINEDEFQAVVSQIAGANRNAMNQVVSSEVKDIVKDLELGKPQLERDKRRFLMEHTSEVHGIGKVHGLTVGHFGRNALVHVEFYAHADEWDEHKDKAWAIADSFEFDDGAEYSKLEALTNPTASRFLSGRSPIMFGAIIGGGVGLVLLVLKKVFGQG